MMTATVTRNEDWDFIIEQDGNRLVIPFTPEFAFSIGHLADIDDHEVGFEIDDEKIFATGAGAWIELTAVKGDLIRTFRVSRAALKNSYTNDEPVD
jgi:hypothetical protein